jgi:hypothetical protein
METDGSSAAAETEGLCARLQRLLGRLVNSASGAAAVADATQFAGWMPWALNQKDAPAGPSLFYTDSCCQELEMLVGVFDTLRGTYTYDVDGIAPAGLKPMPDTAVISIVPDQTSADAACGVLKNASAVGFDIEWTISSKGATRKKVAVLQLATSSYVFLFRLGALVGRDGQLPACLVALLENAAITKAGVKSKADATLLLQDYGVTLASVVELRALVNAKITDDAPSSLAGLTARVLGYHLPKQQDVRISDWDGALTAAQQRYAANDALAGVLIYEVRDAARGVHVEARVRAPTSNNLCTLVADVWCAFSHLCAGGVHRQHPPTLASLACGCSDACCWRC